MGESRISKDIRKAINESGRARIVRNNVGMDLEHGVRYGCGLGSPDFIGVLRDGRSFCIECKAIRGHASFNQLAWWHAARKWGVLGGIARSVDEAMALLDAADGGAR